eukprot:c4671_g1_i1 orf=192-374(+)
MTAQIQIHKCYSNSTSQTSFKTIDVGKHEIKNLYRFRSAASRAPHKMDIHSIAFHVLNIL